ncbi:polyhydroxyalkanoate synthesis repressor PhaR [Aquabacterium sp.]|uniref:polyhydroxyalkanoate synthesis repressor PhaR n=1 Tax=Aquabacterium sp. TaxID=1872578 RepID=UPI0035AFE4DD
MTQPNPAAKRAPAKTPRAAKTKPEKVEGAAADDSGVRVLKKYPNRRLYDSRTSSYITLADIKQMVLDAESFKVVDAKTGEDLTRSILLQVILEEESGGVPMFSTRMLENIIRFYGHAMQGLMGSYLEKNLLTFVDLQGKLAEQSAGLYENKAFSPELWSQFMNQAPMMQGLMGNYLDQSRQLFAQMQEQMHKQAESLFPGFAPKAGDKE